MGASADANEVLEKAIAQHKAGRPADAERLYRLVLISEPRHPLANHNLGVVIVQRGSVGEGVPFFKAARDAAPREGLYWLSYARALLRSGQTQLALGVLEEAKTRGFSGAPLDALTKEAATALGAATAGQPDNPEALFHLGNTMMTVGDTEQAIDSYRRAIAAKPDFAEAHLRLGSVLSENGHIAEGFAHLMRRAELVYGAGGRNEALKNEPLHKTKHDAEQRDYLAGGKAPDDAPQVSS